MKQVRFIPIEDCGLQVREAGEGQAESRRVEGKPIIFGVRSVNLTPWSETRVVYEVLEAGCISQDLISRSDIILNINHSSKVTDVLGRCRNGKGTLDLQMRENYVESGCDLPKTTTANDVLELIRRGDITGMSFAFEDDHEDTENGVSLENTGMRTTDNKEIWLRHVKRIIGLYDVSIVTHPAYEQTSVATREQGDAILRQIDEQIEARKRACGGEKQKENECGGKPEGEETDEENAAREAAEKAEQEKREQEEREERELEESAQRAREQRAMRLRAQRMRTAQEIESLIY